MITGWEIYLFTRLDTLKELTGSTAVLGLVLSGIMFLLYPMFSEIFDRDEDKRKKYLTWTTGLQIAMFFASVLSAFIYAMTPTTKAMVAIKVTPMVSNSGSMQKLGDVGNNMLDLADEWPRELKPKKDE